MFIEKKNITIKHRRLATYRFRDKSEKCALAPFVWTTLYLQTNRHDRNYKLRRNLRVVSGQ